MCLMKIMKMCPRIHQCPRMKVQSLLPANLLGRHGLRLKWKSLKSTLRVPSEPRTLLFLLDFLVPRPVLSGQHLHATSPSSVHSLPPRESFLENMNHWFQWWEMDHVQESLGGTHQSRSIKVQGWYNAVKHETVLLCLSLDFNDPKVKDSKANF